MLTPSEFEHWCRELQLSPAARQMIAAIRTSPPARRVTSHAKNVSGTYPSRKMGVTIQFESHTVELWAIYLMEHDPDVLEFYDQPQTFKLRYQAKSGTKMLGHYYTPDFLVLRKQSVGFEEWKTEDELHRLAAKQPFRYQRMDDGTWRCPPGEEYAQSHGLSFRVCSSASLSRTYIENLIFLEDYIGFMPTVPHQVESRLVELIGATPGIPLAAVVGDGSGIRANDVYTMPGQDMLYTDLHAAHLLQAWRVHLYLDQAQAQAYSHLLPVRVTQRSGVPFSDPASMLAPNALLLWDGRPWTVVNPGETTITLLPEIGLPMQVPAPFFLQLLDAGTITLLRGTSAFATHPEVERLMAEASPTSLRTANERFRLVQAYLEHRTELYAGTSLRTLRRWVKAFQHAQASFGCGYVGLLPRISERGNRTPKAPTASRALMDTFIEEAMQRHGVRAVILDEGQHVMTIGSSASGSSLLDQLDWIKSMTNVTEIVHILVGTYDLLSFTRLNGQTSRRGLPVHFPRYQLQREEDCTEFQAALLALLKKAPLHTDAETLVVKHWLSFYERCIGCVGVLKERSMMCNKQLKPSPGQHEPLLGGASGWDAVSLPSFSSGPRRILHDAR